ncbi:MAG: NUDIX domain-containing protein [Dehalococcoidales bacterium]|nr:NUDIX domain-containing protein [Dehalococcoidales bacterium]
MNIKLTISLKVLLSNENGELLVLQRPCSSKRNPGKWDLPGGRMNLEQPYLLELCREVSEETGLNIEVERIIGITEMLFPLQKVITLIFQGKANSKDVKLSDEHSAFNWITPDRAVNLEFTDKLQVFIKEHYFKKNP